MRMLITKNVIKRIKEENASISIGEKWRNINEFACRVKSGEFQEFVKYYRTFFRADEKYNTGDNTDYD